MATLPQMASVHEKTVQRAEELASSATIHSIRTGHRIRTVTHYAKVDPRVWETALRLANGDPHRIRVVHATEVIVLNPKETR